MSEKCLCCKESEATNIQRQLCTQCYSSLRYADCLEFYPKDRSKLTVHKYSDEVISAYRELLANKDLSLKDIGQRFGYTRERARQVFEAIFGFKFTVVVKKRVTERKNRIDEFRIIKRNPRYKIEHSSNPDCLLHRGALAEKMVLEICELYGYEVKAYCPDLSIDMVINDYLVDVKAAYRTTITSATSKTPHFHFHRSESQRKADFIICYAAPINKFFIIPGSVFPNRNHLYIPEKAIMEWIGLGNAHQVRRSKWYQYLEAWNLLSRHSNEMVFSNTLAANTAVNM